MVRLRRFLVLALLPALAACGNQGPVAKSKGEAYFRGYGCVKCHRIGEEGGDWGPDLTMVGFRKTPQWLALWIENPHAWRAKTIMPNFHLPEDIRTDLVAYLSEQKGQAWAKSGRPWQHADLKGDELKRGETLFNNAGCVSCHGAKGTGGYPNNNVIGGAIPTLTKVSEGYTKEELMEKIRGGVTPAAEDPSLPAPMISMPKWGEVLDHEELEAVASYLISLAPKKSGQASKDSW